MDFGIPQNSKKFVADPKRPTAHFSALRFTPLPSKSWRGRSTIVPIFSPWVQVTYEMILRSASLPRTDVVVHPLQDRP
ncbi:MAG: hypothetical protein MZV63_63280 [Marinilabiliales bacterium]|nr:hypothetical protein [Marinilabiliales bacterium]